MNRNKFLFVVVTTIMIASACTETIDRRIIQADSLSISRPDSAMMIMDSIEPTKGEFSRRELMRYELIRAKVQNRAYVDFTTDSVMKIVADYYDHHGSANDCMLAHYLLGCTYRDMKEAPMALQCYYDAVESADTLSEDCDYSTMMSIWGQISVILSSQGFPYEELEAEQNYGKCAMKNRDTLNYLKSIEHKVLAYVLLGDTIDVLKTTNKASRLYKDFGYDALSAIAKYYEIPIYLNRKDFSKAHTLIERYKRESGYFDQYGNAIKGKEGLYYYQGLYYEGVGKLDSAEFYYRKLFQCGLDFDGCNGLTRVYNCYGNIDSVSKYALLKDKSFDKLQSRLYTHTLHQRKGMYDYSRNQKFALQKENEALRNKVSFFLVSCLLVIVCISSLFFFNFFKNRKKKELTQLANKYISSVIQLNKVSEEQELMKHNFLRLQKEKESEAIALRIQIAELKGNFTKINMDEKVSALINSDLVNHFRRYGQTGFLKEPPSNKDWRELEIGIGHCVPSLSVLINRSNILPLDKQVIILTYLGFSAKEIAVILDKSASRISNLKAISNEKLFNQRDARTLFTNLRDYSS